jgi:hypothetical protein
MIGSFDSFFFLTGVGFALAFFAAGALDAATLAVAVFTGADLAGAGVATLVGFVAGFANHFSGDVHSVGNEMLSIEFKDHYRIAHCKICGARAIVDGTELMYHKQEIGETKVPEGLAGGYDTLKKELTCQK